MVANEAADHSDGLTRVNKAATEPDRGCLALVGQPQPPKVVMDIGNILWLFFIVMALQPLIARRWVQAVRTAKFTAIQKARNSRAFLWA